MSTHADKTPDNRTQSVSNSEHLAQSSGESAMQFVDNSPAGVAQRKLQEMAGVGYIIARCHPPPTPASGGHAQRTLGWYQMSGIKYQDASEMGSSAQRLEAAGRNEIPVQVPGLCPGGKSP